MGKGSNTEDRIMRFHALYVGVIKEGFDRAEFEADDLYAFQAFERALRSENQELRNLAAHLQAERQADIETITLSSTEPMARTRKLSTLPAEPAVSGAAAAPASPPVQRRNEGRNEGRTERRSEGRNERRNEAPAAPPAQESAPRAEAPRPERRSGDARLSREQIAMAAEFQRLYSQEFRTPLDIGQFIFDDDYGRALLYQSLGAANHELFLVAKQFLDEGGHPRLHRRGTSQPPHESA